jgi:hypothetical protein
MRILALLVSLSVLFGVASASPWPGMAKETLGGIQVGATADAVAKKLGKPAQKDKPVEESATGEWVTTWTFADDTAVTLASAKAKGPYTVRSVDASGKSKAKTVEGIGVGSTLADLQKAYGKALVRANDHGAWRVDGELGYLSFLVEHDQVTSLGFSRNSSDE